MFLISRPRPLFSLWRLVAFFATALWLSGCSQEDRSAVSIPPPKPALYEDVASADIATIKVHLDDGSWTSEQLVAAYLARIEDIDPRINAVLSINPNALDEARKRDQERADGQQRGNLHGIPILLKDNIETKDEMPTTAGSLALAENFAVDDAPMVANLRAEGAIILGKTNLSEWANFRSFNSISGWSGVGGQTRNAHYLDRSACGSSSGSAAAMAARLAAATIGTETDGSIICPSNANGVVGFKPTLGLVSRSGIVPIAATQDTAGPITASVMDAAFMLTSMAGSDEADAATFEADQYKADYARDLSADWLRGKRVGVLHFATGEDPRVIALFRNALSDLEKAGAVLVDISDYEQAPTLWDDEFFILQVEFKATLNTYLANTPDRVSVRSLADLIAFNANTPRELVLFDQSLLEASLDMVGMDDPTYLERLARLKKSAREEGIDQLLSQYDVDILVSPSMMPAFLIEPVFGDQFMGGTGWTGMAAIAGYPHLSVPMGDIEGLPIGLSFIGGKWQDAQVLQAGYAYEQATHKMMTPNFLQSLNNLEAIKQAQDKYE